jgi:hypothetical protein
MFGKRVLFIDSCSRPGRESSNVNAICGQCRRIVMSTSFESSSQNDNLVTTFRLHHDTSPYLRI